MCGFKKFLNHKIILYICKAFFFKASRLFIGFYDKKDKIEWHLLSIRWHCGHKIRVLATEQQFGNEDSSILLFSWIKILYNWAERVGEKQTDKVVGTLWALTWSCFQLCLCLICISSPAGFGVGADPSAASGRPTAERHTAATGQSPQVQKKKSLHVC